MFWSRVSLFVSYCRRRRAGQSGASGKVTPQELARIWDSEHVSPPLPPLLDHPELVKRLEKLRETAPELFELEKIGESIEGRSINHVRVGTGSLRVLLWSQMHGDESTATAALFDVFEYLQRHREDPLARRVLSRLTLDIVPMLNPDGAERFQRRNAQSIDVNRDALRLQTPEGRALKALRDRYNPSVGFNLHNQNWRTSVGDPPKPASISLLSVAYDEPRTENAGRKLTKKLCAVIRDSLEPFASGQIGRYDDEFEVRAFGDNITLWGTPVVLIETGPWPSEQPDPALVRLNFVAILSALDSLATGDVERADPRRYESLPMNESRLLYVLDQERDRHQRCGRAAVHLRHRDRRYQARSLGGWTSRPSGVAGNRRHGRLADVGRLAHDRRDRDDGDTGRRLPRAREGGRSAGVEEQERFDDRGRSAGAPGDPQARARARKIRRRDGAEVAGSSRTKARPAGAERGVGPPRATAMGGPAGRSPPV